MRTLFGISVRSPAFGPAIVLFLALLWATAASAQKPERGSDQILSGTITGSDHQRYIRAPFVLPEGTERLVVSFDYDGRDHKTVIDLGIEDPHGFRGASGGNKASFTIAPTDATPSYLPGPLPAGEWALALAVPNIREGVTAQWQAELWFLRGAEAQWLPDAPAGRGPGWYRGDLHLHTAHSDGSCDSRSGQRVPCPTYRTIEAAADRGLDFVALTEHNTASQAAPLRELAPYFDDMLLIPAREITTFYGHFNVYGVTSFLDFRIAKGSDNSFADIAEQVRSLGGLVSINHPRLPSGEICMGCGWTMPGADLAHADAVEVINGSSSASGGGPEGPVSGIPFWVEALAQGHRLAAIGGSDNHDPARSGDGAVGVPATVVYAEDLSQGAILEGLRRGRSFIDVEGSGQVHLDFTVRTGEATAKMGGRLRVSDSAPIALIADLKAPVGTMLEVLVGTDLIEARPLDGRSDSHTFSLTAERGTRPVWLKLRNSDGDLVALSSALVLDVE
ncbi:PHP domain-containing protein [Pelagerythrobacter rhizovicinus]|uniref:PHP domain-containing protein n=1 Tax=Pelagerythrobacter rhizovicinus TaxID=2268576 RepID=A0A4Q2KMA1_9SPHN|nr:PHP domain-containing protein [Pelagerythrobacter rhizovicinus]